MTLFGGRCYRSGCGRLQQPLSKRRLLGISVGPRDVCLTKHGMIGAHESLVTIRRTRAMWPASKFSALLGVVVILVGCSSPGSDLPTLPAKPDVSSYHLGAADRLGIKV